MPAKALLKEACDMPAALARGQISDWSQVRNWASTSFLPARAGWHMLRRSSSTVAKRYIGQSMNEVEINKLDQRAGPHGRRQRTLVEIIELAANRHAMS